MSYVLHLWRHPVPVSSEDARATLHDLRHAPQPQKHLLVMGKSMNFIDLAGAELWEAELNARRAMGGDLYFHRPRPEVIRMWATTGFTRLLGPEHQFPDKRSAIATIFTRLDPAIYPIEDDQQFFLELLQETKVMLVQGTGFNWAAPDHFRIVFLPHEDDLRDAIGRVARFLEQYRKRCGTDLRRVG